ncbi:MAG: AmmeMemoRadiSam system protein B [Spirochaetales bacterium]|nr:AmmeMemoRadiSam system protein B [Spirochaetales bacterium]
MKNIRYRVLPPGWYPDSHRAAASIIKRWSANSAPDVIGAVAGIAPHAGWEYSGELAFSVIRCLAEDTQVIAVIGGHLSANGSLMMSYADEYETPLGNIVAASVFRKELSRRLTFIDDTAPDNTVEIQLPIVRHFFPRAKVLFLRAPASEKAILLGERLHEISQRMGVKAGVIGSTDLTHYGPAYGFSPAGSGKEAVNWVREQNDKPLLEHLLALRLKEAVHHGVSRGSACSVGAAAAAGAFAGKHGVKTGTLVGYSLSCEKISSESFVGYGAIIYA